MKLLKNRRQDTFTYHTQRQFKELHMTKKTVTAAKTINIKNLNKIDEDKIKHCY